MCEREKSKGNKLLKNISKNTSLMNRTACMREGNETHTPMKSRAGKKGMRIIAGWIIRIYCSAFNTQVVENNAWIFPEKKENGIGKTERKVKKKFPAPFFFFLRERSKTFHNLECVILFHFICDAKRKLHFLTISNVKSRRTTSHIIYIREGNSELRSWWHKVRMYVCWGLKSVHKQKTSPQADVARCCCCSFFTHPKFFTASPSTSGMEIELKIMCVCAESRKCCNSFSSMLAGIIINAS